MRVKSTTTCVVCNDNFDRTEKSRRITCSKACEYKLKVKNANLHEQDPQEKICKTCGNSFFDKTSRKKATRCKICINASMVETRKRNGTYVRTSEQNEKLSKTLIKKYEQGWNEKSPELLEKLSTGLKERWQDGSMARKTIETSLEKYGVEHWTKTDAAKSFTSERKKGKKLSKESRAKMSVAAAKRIRENNNHYQRGNGKYREDLGHYVRSNWEANFARILLLQNRAYEYEPTSFVLNETTTYTPDFKVGEVFYEIKGYMSEKDRKKIQDFKEKYPDIPLEIIGPREYNRLRLEYSNKVIWEGK